MDECDKKGKAVVIAAAAASDDDSSWTTVRRKSKSKLRVSFVEAPKPSDSAAAQEEADAPPSGSGGSSALTAPAPDSGGATDLLQRSSVGHHRSYSRSSYVGPLSALCWREEVSSVSVVHSPAEDPVPTYGVMPPSSKIDVDADGEPLSTRHPSSGLKASELAASINSLVVAPPPPLQMALTPTVAATCKDPFSNLLLLCNLSPPTEASCLTLFWVPSGIPSDLLSIVGAIDAAQCSPGDSLSRAVARKASLLEVDPQSCASPSTPAPPTEASSGCILVCMLKDLRQLPLRHQLQAIGFECSNGWSCVKSGLAHIVDPMACGGGD
ncbi:hypothetical protein Cni_G25757 [Canna indica]|uniref:Uncharacterized protein n=1 Tax=Canna indica TaxID=4628 RepID=A0AAQ3KY77_9LILI|nr:hypothetical protein Cni_G25757 [Canna indica]